MKNPKSRLPKPPWYAHDGEDRICRKLFGRIGTTSQTAVEFGAHDGFYKSNTAYFAIVEGWRCILFDAEPRSELVRKALITAENINEIFDDAEVPEDLDLLSIDIDGNDLWVWKALTYRPRVVIIEFNPKWRPIRRRTIPYDPTRGAWDQTDYYGASAGALVELGKEKGYALYESTSANLIFAQERFVEMPKSVYQVRQRTKKEKLDPYDRPWVGYP
jgi:hypothetical protein